MGGYEGERGRGGGGEERASVLRSEDGRMIDCLGLCVCVGAGRELKWTEEGSVTGCEEGGRQA